MHLVTCSLGAHIFLGAQLGSWVIDLQLAYQAYANDSDIIEKNIDENRRMMTDMTSWLESGDRALSITKKVVTFFENQMSTVEKSDIPGFIYPSANVGFLPPILRPGKVICVGMNYPEFESITARDHLKFPVLFHKVATSLVGHNQPIRIPRITNSVVYEGELALVIGRYGKNIPEDQAELYIAGYTIANDIGAPDLERRTSQWTSGKMLDTFCPLGPALVTTDDIPQLDDLWIKTSLNNEIVQYGSPVEMVFDIPYLVSYISELVTLEPGDLILTGSPKKTGMKPDPRTPMFAGDNISVEINGLGILANPVMAEAV